VQAIQHKHFIGRFQVENPPSNIGYLEDWMRELIDAQGMQLLNGPHVEYVMDLGNRGLTGVAIIKTSHLAIHVWDEAEPGLVQLDFYTCSHLDLDLIMRAVEPWGVIDHQFLVIDRENNLDLQMVRA
jgi:S-adenosylmethionine/arginine decarboxylase-like enzyme